MKNIKKLLTALFCLTLSLGMVACASTEESASQDTPVGESSVIETPESSGQEPEAPARATYKVTFKQEGQEDKVFDVIEGEALTDVPTPVDDKAGYSVAWDVADFSNITGDVTVNAVYTIVEYTVSFTHPGTGMPVAAPITYTVETMEEVVFPEVPADLAMEGHTVAWNKTVEDLAIGGLDVNPVYTAIEYTVSFTHPRTGMPVAEPITYTVETIEEVVFPAVPEVEGYTGVWNKTPADLGIGGLDVNPEYTANTYVITYNANGGAAVANQDVTYDAEYTLSSTSRENYEFMGWYVADADGNATETKLEDGTWSIAENVTVVAAWDFIDGEYAAKYNFNIDGVTFITKEAYEGGTVSFKYFIPEGTITAWFGIAWHTDPAKANIYHAAGIEDAVGYHPINVTTGAWTTVEFELPDDDAYYLYFGSPVANDQNPVWTVNGENSYILFDDFQIGDVTEDFNGGVEDSIFDVLIDGAVTFADGLLPFEEGEYAMKYIFNVSGETVSQVTKQAYAGGSEVSFRYFIPAGTPTSWWGLAYSTSNTGLDIYAAADSSKAHAISKDNTATGGWTNVSFTLPSGGPYYLYFGSEVGTSHGRWMLNGENSYMLIDDFTVNEETEDFNKGLDENTAFSVLVGNAVVNSEKGEGYVPPEPQPLGAKLTIDLISSTTSTPSFITAKAYTLTEETTVTFDYYMTGNTNDKWWTFNWTTSNTVANIYAFVEPTATNNGVTLPRVQDSWQTTTITVPAGTWYFYFAGAVTEWGEGYVIVDNIQIGDVVSEDFNKGLGIFLDNREGKQPNAITLVDGKQE